jgi:multicomponent K+:H+ antiporter subunit A
MRAPIQVLVLACVVVGVLPGAAIGGFLATAARPVVGGTLPEYSLALWHGFNAPLAMSLVALAGGVATYILFARQRRQGRLDGPPLLRHLDGKRAFEALLAASTDLARRAVRRTSSPHLQRQLLWMVLAAGTAALTSALVVPLEWGSRPRVPATLDFVLLWLVGGAAAVGAAWHARFHRLFSLVLLGVTGVVVCVTFAWFSAPDLALTQIAVESVTLLFFLLGLRWLPKPVTGDEDPRLAWRALWRRSRDLVISVLAGAGLAAVSYALLTRTGAQSISPFYLEQALPGGGGRNVVNVMLVDFRAFDTLGEITVLAVVGLTVYALLRRFRPVRELMEVPRQQWLLQQRTPRGAQDPVAAYLLVPTVLVRLMLPVTLLVAAYLFLRGHNLPGGGFVAGLTALGGGTAGRPAAGLDRGGAARRCHHRGGLARLGLSAAHHAHGALRMARAGRGPSSQRRVLRPRRVPGRARLHDAAAHGAGPPVRPRAPPSTRRCRLMEAVIAIAIGVLTSAGVWLVLRPRTFQVLVGLSLLSYATNLFIFSVGSLSIAREPIVQPGVAADLVQYTDPLPQALVLTAIVIGFATTALFLVVLLALRGLTDSDHVDGGEERP